MRLLTVPGCSAGPTLRFHSMPLPDPGGPHARSRDRRRHSHTDRPRRAVKGSLKTVRADDLAAIPLRALIERNPEVNFAETGDV